jgi:beta-xylosidase
MATLQGEGLFRSSSKVRLAGVKKVRTGLFCLIVAALGSIQSASSEQFDAARQYRNPVLFADYSDPDVIRDGKDFYLIASSFHFVPGIPVLHSLDLVHWEIVGHVVPRLTMSPAYDMKAGNRYSGGIWAPSVRFHAGLFYVYFPTPDEGIFVSTAPSMTGPWTEPVSVLPGAGWEDPCPFWDDDGNAYLIHSKLRAGPLILHRMSQDGMHLLDKGTVIVSDPVNLPVLEGPKFYKRNGWYYIFAPMGGVGTGEQVALRSRNIYGPYESRRVLAQGDTTVNGPHQGGWVEGPDGRGWFLHFQQRGPHGRIVWLEPVTWKNDWPVMGASPSNGHIVAEPVLVADLPVVLSNEANHRPRTSDEFSSPTLSPMWEWNHNPDDARWSLKERNGFLRLHPTPADNLVHARNTLTETMQDESFEVTTRVELNHMSDSDQIGLSIFERSLSSVGVIQHDGKRAITFTIGKRSISGPSFPLKELQTIELRASVSVDVATYSYSLDEGRTFHPLGERIKLAFSWWKGARPALFAFNPLTESNGFVDFDWMHYRPIPESRPTRPDLAKTSNIQP